ncbi:HtaA domain-containing protein [Streptomyces sp. NPDC057702]|uniref:HtaA domain-containing protein n=1 Tax=unclassified Streptomyces TaxID=2593676 RepID=UPI0036CA1BBE
MSATHPAPRRTRRASVVRTAAIATAATLGAAALSLPVVAYAAGGDDKPSAPPKLELRNGTLDWGVKASFRKYVAGPIAHGEITVSGGARQAAGNGPFTFVDGAGTYDTGTHAVSTAFKGGVRFAGHEGKLDLRLSDVKLSTARTTGAITADVSAKDMNTGKVTNSDDVRLADLDLSAVRPGQGEGGAMTFANIPAKLTADGAKAFNGFYAAGDDLDPATLTVTPGGPVKPEPTNPPTGKPTDQPTGKPTDQPTGKPTDQPTGKPTDQPTGKPTDGPTTGNPTGNPTGGPTAKPTDQPTGKPTSGTGERSGASGEIFSGNLDWGVKEGFRKYVTGPIASGKVTLSGGAAKRGQIYRFPQGGGSYQATDKSLDAKFAGAVRFTGHAGKLDLSVSDLKVRVKGSRGTLVADLSSKDMKTGKVTKSDNLTLADLRLPAGGPTVTGKVVTLKNVPATLTASGAKAFAGYYHAGERLDPVNVAVSLDKGASLPGGVGTAGGTADADGQAGSGGEAGSGGTGGVGGTGSGTEAMGTGGVTGGGSTGGSGSLAATGADVPTGVLLGAAGVLVVGGGAAAFAVRRRSAATPAQG